MPIIPPIRISSLLYPCTYPRFNLLSLTSGLEPATGVFPTVEMPNDMRVMIWGEMSRCGHTSVLMQCHMVLDARFSLRLNEIHT